MWRKIMGSSTSSGQFDAQPFTIGVQSDSFANIKQGNSIVINICQDLSQVDFVVYVQSLSYDMKVDSHTGLAIYSGSFDPSFKSDQLQVPLSLVNINANSIRLIFGTPATTPTNSLVMDFFVWKKSAEAGRTFGLSCFANDGVTVYGNSGHGEPFGGKPLSTDASNATLFNWGQ
jgi:hypothetical protein